MDLFQHRYYKLNKTLMTIIGQWPYQSTRSRRNHLAILTILSTSQIIPVILALVKYRNDGKIVVDCLLSILFIAMFSTQFIGLMSNSQTTLKLLNFIRTDWPVWARDPEVEILCRYSEQGRKLSVVHTAMIYSVLFVYMSQPVISKIINVLLMNGTKPGSFPFPVDYYHLDMQKYYYYIIMYSWLCTCLACTVLVASDVMFITNVQHVCGLFAALGHKLERIRNNHLSSEKGITPHMLYERDMLHLASCIDRHNDAIEYATLMENSYRWPFYFIIGIGMIQFNVSALQILIRKSNSEENAKFIAFISAIGFMFLVYTYLSQILMDHSISIGFHVHNLNWYVLSVKAQKLLQFMYLRSSIPCQLTAGKMLIMCMRNFMLVTRTALSYLTFVRSMHSE